MALFEDLYEEPSIDYIETLLVIVSILLFCKLKMQPFLKKFLRSLTKFEIGILLNSTQ
jgi:hypothetical protein